MGIRFRCKSCGQKYELDESFAGRNAKCNSCKDKLVVPITSELPPRSGQPSDTSGSVRRSVAVPVADLLELKIKKVKSIRSGGKKASAEDIVFRCKLCNQKYRLSREMAGQTAECAKCRRNIVIPLQSESHATLAEQVPLPTVQPGQTEQEITFWCRLCRQKYRLAGTLSGHIVKCVRCRQNITIPLQSEATPPPKRDVPQMVPATPSDPSLQVVFRCKSCGIKYRLSRKLAGALVNCSRCQSFFEVPAASDPELASPVKPQIVETTSRQKGQPDEIPAKKAAPEEIPRPTKDETVIETVVPTEFENGKTAILSEASTTINSFARYVLEIPERNFLAGMLYGIGCFCGDWLKRFRIFQDISKNSLLTGAGIVIFLLAVYIFSLIAAPEQKNAPVKCDIHSMCETCGHHEVKKTVDLRNEKCAKCRALVGAAWQCADCDKYFPFFEERAPKPKSREELTGDLIKCPFCNSANVNYASVPK